MRFKGSLNTRPAMTMLACLQRASLFRSGSRSSAGAFRSDVQIPMSLGKSGPSDRSPSNGAPGPSKISLAVLAIALGLLVALVASLYPPHPKLKPAPLEAYPPGCLKLRHNFTPTNITEIPDLSGNKLSAPAQNRVLLRVNMEPCTCGCNHSIADCRLTNPSCETSRKLIEQEVAAGKGR